MLVFPVCCTCRFLFTRLFFYIGPELTSTFPSGAFGFLFLFFKCIASLSMIEMTCFYDAMNNCTAFPCPPALPGCVCTGLLSSDMGQACICWNLMYAAIYYDAVFLFSTGAVERRSWFLIIYFLNRPTAICALSYRCRCCPGYTVKLPR